MNKSIIWDKKIQKFGNIIVLDYFNRFIKTDIEYPKDYYPSHIGNIDNYIILNLIGLEDINGKNIYADSSIFELEWGQNKHNIIGYFTFNEEFLQYEIIMLNIQKNKSLAYNPYNCINFKIIDTIQENKLGLIKG